ncbi:MAG: thiamine pyrophosphate-requiring protein [Chitinivibrionales bacterium]|nr:thiamine pyrophosphate-requiring protein [Chitinivibrionales bacterium]
MAKTTADFMVDRLYEWKVRRVYGYPGDGINGLLGALARQQKKIRFIQARHEEEAAFMACAHAKFTGSTGVCMATSGPGAVHLLNGLYDAKMDHQPVVAIVGQQPTTALGSHFQQEIDLVSLYKDVAHEFVYMASTPAQVRHLLDRAFRIAAARRTVTCVIVPNDVQEADAVASPPRKHGSNFSGIGYNRPEVVPSMYDLKAAAEILNAGQRVAILAGAGAAGAADELQEVADVLGAGVAKSLLGKPVLSDELPYVTGVAGLLGTKPSWDLMMGCDTLLVVGSTFPYAEHYPREGQARGVQIDIDAGALSVRYPMELNLVGDSRLTLRRLLPLLEHKTNRGWRDKMENEVREWWQVLEARARHAANPVNPQLLFWELSPKLPDNAILTCDSGSAANWYARDIKMRPGMMGSLSGGLATMCPGVPYAIAAKFCHPERPVVAMVGDGAMQMLGNDGLVTIEKYWKEWANPVLVVLVLHNNDLNQVTWEQRALTGDPKFAASQDIPDFPYATYARLLGLHGLEVAEPREIGPAFDAALESDAPTVIDALCDPNVPPIAPHITFDQMKGYVSALAKGDPNTLGVVGQSAREMMSTLLTRSRR